MYSIYIAFSYSISPIANGVVVCLIGPAEAVVRRVGYFILSMVVVVLLKIS